MALKDVARSQLRHLRPARLQVRGRRIGRYVSDHGPHIAANLMARSRRLSRSPRSFVRSLPGKLLLLTLAFVMLAEVLIFVPSIANFRVNWLMDRLTAGRLAALAAKAAPDGTMPQELRQELLNNARVQAIAVKEMNIRRMILPADQPLSVDASFDLRRNPDRTFFEGVGYRISLIGQALYVFIAPEGRMIRAYGQTDPADPLDDFVEVVLDETALCNAMLDYALNILLLSIVISLITATLVYFALSRVLVNPMLALSRNMVAFAEHPEDAERIIQPSGRSDELGVAEHELAEMQRQLSQALTQKNRLAQLGLAVSKINHDLRNMLASAQILSDRLAMVPDPTVQRFTPKLVASLDRAINFCNDTLKFGRAEEAAPRRDVFPLRPLIDEVAEGLQLPRENIHFENEVAASVTIDADREHIYRVLNNVIRNAVDALEGHASDDRAIRVSAHRERRATVIRIADNGPGVPEKARKHMFKAFQGNARPGGTGLGLAIAAELVMAHGGEITLCEAEPGTDGAVFQIAIRDRRLPIGKAAA